MRWNEWWMTWIPITMARWTSPSSSSSWGRWPWPATTSSWTARRPKSPTARTMRLQQRKRKSNEQMLQKQREKTERSINRLHGWEQESAQVSSISLTGTEKPRSWRRFLCFYNSTQVVNKTGKPHRQRLGGLTETHISATIFFLSNEKFLSIRGLKIFQDGCLLFHMRAHDHRHYIWLYRVCFWLKI